MRFFRSRVLFIAAISSLIASGSLAFLGVTSASAAPGITVHCDTAPPGALDSAIISAPVGATINVDGTCYGNFVIDKNLTLVGPAILDGNNSGPALSVNAGTVALNDLTLQHGTGLFDFAGGGLWNAGRTTLNRSTITNNSAPWGGGVFNYGQLTLNRSTVSNNQVTLDGAGIFNCGTRFSLCTDTGAPGSLTLNSSTVSGNVAGVNGGGIANDAQATLTMNGSILAGNTGGGAGGLNNVGSATLNNSTVQGNDGGIAGGGINTSGQLTINKSTVSSNTAFYGSGLFVFSGTTTAANSTFSNTPGDGGIDSTGGVFVLGPQYGGAAIFTATHCTFG